MTQVQHDVLVAVLGLAASVLGGLILGVLKRLLTAQEATNAHVVANTEAKVATVLDVASLQGWARDVDVKLAGLMDKSTDLQRRATLDRRLAELEQFKSEWEGIIGRVGADQVSR